MSKTKKLLALVLSVLTFLGVFSCSTTVFAEEYNSYVAEREYQDKLLTEAVENEKQKAEIVCEVPEKRDEFSKTYKRADGSFTTVFSKTPLHTYDGSEWKEIDNSLQSNGDVIENADGKFDVEFPESLSSDDKITIENQGENISFSLNNIDESTAQVAPDTEAADVVENDLGKPVSEITYENIGENTDVQYIVSSNYVKENIIVSDKSSLKDTYSFTIEKGDLTATLGDDNSLTFKNAQGETAFTIPAPVMTDAAKAVSYDIGVSVANESTSTLTLTYTPSKEWLESSDRAYPVTLDPVVEMPSDDESIIEDVMIGYDYSDPDTRHMNTYNQSESYVVNTDNLHTDILVNIDMNIFAGLKNPEIEITDTNYYVNGKVEGGNVLVKEINGTWDATAITYDDVYPADGSTPQITYGTDTIDFASGGESTEFSLIYFNITDIFKDALANNTKADFAIVAEDSTVRGEFELGTTSTEWVHNTYLSVDYVDTSCENDSFEYLTQEIGRAGTAYVNTFSRSLSLTRNDISMDGLRMPVGVGFAYNPAFRNFGDIYLTATGMDLFYPYGNGWLPLNLQALFSINENQWQAFTGEGTLVTFNQTTETVGEGEDAVTKIVFEPDSTSDSGYSLELIDETKEPSNTNLRLISPDGYATYFHSGGVATAICDSEDELTPNTEAIRYSYPPEGIEINKITDGTGRQYVFTYNETTGLLEKINCLTADGTQIKAGTTDSDLCVTYSYDSNGNLTGVTYPDGKTVAYTYSGDSLVKAENIDGYSIQYTYDNSGKVTKLEEFAGTTAGNLITLHQLSNRQVKVDDAYLGASTYQFGRDGKLNYTFDDKGNYSKSDYAPANDENVYSSSEWKISSENLLKNGSFEDVSNSKADEWSNSFLVEDINDDDLISDYVCKISATEKTNIQQSQTIAVNGGNTYTFTVQAKSNLSELTNTDRLYISITAEDEDGNATTQSKQLMPTDEFEQYSVTVTKDTEIVYITVEFGLKNKTGDFSVNNAQLESGYGTAPFNYIENGSFNNENVSWSDFSTVKESINGKAVDAVKLSGGLPEYTGTTLVDNISAVTQSVEINGVEGQIYSIGGWFKGEFDDNHISDDVSIDASQAVNSLAQIKVSYSYAETTTDENGNETTETKPENFVVDFAPNNNGWQYAVDSFALKADVESVNVTVMAKNIPADSFATGIELTLTENATLLNDENESFTISDQASSYYSDGTTLEECRCEECEEVNCECRCESEEQCTCVQCKRKTTTQYDSFGNLTYTEKTDGISIMSTETVYSDDGNYITGAKDENDVFSTFSQDPVYDTQLPLNVSIAGQETDYTFNSGAHLDSVSKVVSDLLNGNKMQVNYTYDGDKITAASHNGHTYNFEYDVWGNIAKEKVNNQTIVNYMYGANQFNEQLQKKMYENGQSIWYDYDDSGNMCAIKYTGDTDWRYIWDYTNTEKTTITDNAQNYSKEITENGYKITDLSSDSVVYSKSNLSELYNGIEYVKTINDDVYSQADGSTTQSFTLSGISNATKNIYVSNLIDWFGRNKKNTITLSNSENTVSLSKSYDYVSYDENTSTTKYVEYFTNNVKVNNVDSFENKLKYSYDHNGNVSTVSTVENNAPALQYEYYYDEANQLVQVDDYLNNILVIYQYDVGGNIVSAKEYELSTYYYDSTPINEETYIYNSVWSDRLDSYNGKPLTYDSIGNLLTYDGKTHTWFAGRMLQSMQTDTYSLSFNYDENGFRSQKTVVSDGASKTYKYIWVDDILIGQTDGMNTLRFIYNDEDEIIGFVKNDSQIYLYVKNLLGDVIGIVDENGSFVVEYEYDAWGELLSVSGSLAETIGLENPIRYRGYYYDNESGYYYLQSRYYDPELRRFINADILEGMYSPKSTYLYADTINPFAYCANSPVHMVDFSGEKQRNNSKLYAIRGFLFVVTLSLFDQFIKIYSDKELADAGKILYKDSKKGVISIDIRGSYSQKEGRRTVKYKFSDILYSYYQLLGYVSFSVLASYALEKFYNDFATKHNRVYSNDKTEKRKFLFSDLCVTTEIKHHCLGYWYTEGLIPYWKSSYRLYWGSKITKKELAKSCEQIDIAEQDVFKIDDRAAFGYFSGIRNTYGYTMADPYWYGNLDRYNIPRTDWKTKKIPWNAVMFDWRWS